MQTIVVRAPAKLNLTFDILGTRPDGFHDIETIFQSISLEDELEVKIEEAELEDFQIECDNPIVRRLIPLDANNLIGKAAKAFIDSLQTESKYKIHVQLEKRIPVGAGLAGGSSNAAAMLLAMNKAFAEPLTLQELLVVAAQVGSDVPFCLKGGTCLGRGRGEILTELDCKLELCFCIVKPRKLSVSTQWAYKSFDEFKGPVKSPSLDKAIRGLASADLELALAGFANVFEPLVFQEYPELAKLKNELLAHGAWACHMTGSGPTLFAIVAGREMGHHIRRQILNDDEIGFVYGTEEIILEALPPIDFRLAESISSGARIIC
jgi:4-diphosphocytidyl-2-C-methyl-D-erythritol kinase